VTPLFAQGRSAVVHISTILTRSPFPRGIAFVLDASHARHHQAQGGVLALFMSRAIPLILNRRQHKVPMTSRQALAFIRKHGVVLESARGPVPSLAEVIAREPLRGRLVVSSEKS
jgi:hypothetical protein